MAQDKPVVTGPVDGNVFSVIAAVSAALKKAGQRDEAKEFTAKAFKAGSYNDVLVLAMEVVEFDL